jgi:hypothetical protein
MTAVLIDEHVHESVEQTLFIGQRVVHHSKKMTDL